MLLLLLLLLLLLVVFAVWNRRPMRVQARAIRVKGIGRGSMLNSTHWPVFYRLKRQSYRNWIVFPSWDCLSVTCAPRATFKVSPSVCLFLLSHLTAGHGLAITATRPCLCFAVNPIQYLNDNQLRPTWLQSGVPVVIQFRFLPHRTALISSSSFRPSNLNISFHFISLCLMMDVNSCACAGRSRDKRKKRNRSACVNTKWTVKWTVVQ